jgi:hypothetical protein
VCACPVLQISCLHGASLPSITHISPPKACTWQLPRMHTFWGCQRRCQHGSRGHKPCSACVQQLKAARGPFQQVAALIAIIWVTACDIANNGVCICPDAGTDQSMSVTVCQILGTPRCVTLNKSLKGQAGSPCNDCTRPGFCVARTHFNGECKLADIINTTKSLLSL